MSGRKSRLVRLALLVVLSSVACSNPEKAKRAALDNGNEYFASKQYREAIVEYQNALSYDANFVEAHQRLAESHLALGNGGRAFQEFIRVADLIPDDPDAQIKAGNFLLLAGQFEDAKTRALRAIEKAPRSVEARVLLANATAGLKDIDTAIQQAEEAIKLEPNSRAYQNLAVLRLRSGQYDLAEAEFKRAIEADPRSAAALLSLANFYWQTGHPEQAETLLKQALAIDPEHRLANRAASLFYLAANRPAEAEPYMRKLSAIAGTPQADLSLADYYFALGRFKDAAVILDKLKSEKMVFTAVQVRLASLAAAENRLSDAHALLDTAIAHEPNAPEPLTAKADLLFLENRLTDADQYAARAVRAAPESAVAHYIRGRIAVRMDKIDVAIQAFNEVLRLNPLASAAQLQLSNLQLARGAVDEGLQLAEAALKNQPGLSVARFAVVRALVAKGDVDRASRELTSLLKEYPKSSSLHSANGSLLLRKGDLTGARAAFELAAQLNPNSYEALVGLTTLDTIGQRIPEAVARINRHLATSPKNAGLLMMGAKLHGLGGNNARMEEFLRKAIEVDRANPEPYWILGQYYLSQGKLEEARVEHERAIAQRPDSVPSATMVALILQTQGKTDEATKRYEQILEKNPRAAIAANNLANIYADRGEKLDDALMLAQNAVSAAPNDAKALDTLGWVYYKKKLPEMAIPVLERSLTKDPANPTLHYHLGVVLAEIGYLDRARRSLEEALRLNDAFPEHEDAKKRLRTLVETLGQGRTRG
jgi:tetratricopeptide (TPR) repeat protein